jgi:hypothetical protein
LKSTHPPDLRINNNDNRNENLELSQELIVEMRGRSGVAVASSGEMELPQGRLVWSPIRQEQRQQSPYTQPVAPRTKPAGSSEGVKEWELRSRIEAARHYRTAVIEALAKAAKEMHDVKELKVKASIRQRHRGVLGDDVQ